jgi:hypothetical protein
MISSALHPPSPFRSKVNGCLLHTLSWFWFVTPRTVLRALPGSSLQFGPPRRCARWRDYQRRFGGEWREVFPARTTELPPPFFCNDSRAVFSRVAGRRWPAVGVATLREGRILDEHGWAVGVDDTLLGDFCLWGNSRLSRVNHLLKLRPARRLPGRTLNLCSAQAGVNFYHYLMEGVGRAALVRGAGFRWDDFDQIVLPRFRSAATAEVDRALGIPNAKVIRMRRHEQFICDFLIQPSLPGLLAQPPAWLIEFYRELFSPPADARRGRRLYFPRRGVRQALNSEEIDALVTEHGFETVDPMKTPDLHERLATATHVVGLHGAALTNLVFCQPGTRVLEIMPGDIAHHHNAAYYYTLCGNGGMPYGAVVGPSRRERLLPTGPQSWSEFHVPLDDLAQGLAALLSG